MSAGQTRGSWDEWVRALERVLANLDSIGDVPCPTCGAHTLRIVFTGDEDDRIGYANFWCDTSMDGIFTSRIHVPGGVPMLPFRLPGEERLKYVPNYAIIPPAPTEDDDSESVTF